ncbi:glycosyltransferase family 39 protein [Aggregatilineales bacterium SYSU G02658]
MSVKRPLFWLGVICGAAFLFRLALLPLAQHPGIGDPNHYYNLGQRLLDGHGFTIDYIWAFIFQYERIEHPEDHWMPLTGLLTAASMSLFGREHTGAVVLFALVGALLPALAYLAARRLDLEPSEALAAALLTSVVPELVLNSLRTDTTILNAVFVGAALLALSHALESDDVRWYALTGALAGLAYLVRTDSLLIVGTAGLLVVWRWLSGRTLPRWRILLTLVLPLAALIVAAPWLIRNVVETGQATTPALRYFFLKMDFRELYSYTSIPTLETLLNDYSLADLLYRRLFELAAALRLMTALLKDGVTLLLAVGLWTLWRQRSKSAVGRLMPIAVTLGLLLIFYPVLIPIGNQGGSFKKAYLSLVPLIVPIAIYGLRRAVPEVRLRAGVVLITTALMAMSAFELVRDQNRFVNTFIASMERVVSVLETLPDTNDDGRLIVMTQDPFVLRYLGYQGVQFPFEDRDTIFYVAQRYGVDYLLMPSARPALEPIETGDEQDERFEFVTNVARTNYTFWRVVPPN